MYAPVTVGSDQDPLPIGDWKVVGIFEMPIFKLQPGAVLGRGSDCAGREARIAAGPNNPVGLGLDSDQQGALRLSRHTRAVARPDASESHGCVRLTNWDALRLAALVQPEARRSRCDDVRPAAHVVSLGDGSVDPLADDFHDRLGEFPTNAGRSTRRRRRRPPSWRARARRCAPHPPALALPPAPTRLAAPAPATAAVDAPACRHWACRTPTSRNYGDGSCRFRCRASRRRCWCRRSIRRAALGRTRGAGHPRAPRGTPAIAVEDGTVAKAVHEPAWRIDGVPVRARRRLLLLLRPPRSVCGRPRGRRAGRSWTGRRVHVGTTGNAPPNTPPPALCGYCSSSGRKNTGGRARRSTRT